VGVGVRVRGHVRVRVNASARVRVRVHVRVTASARVRVRVRVRVTANVRVRVRVRVNVSARVSARVRTLYVNEPGSVRVPVQLWRVPISLAWVAPESATATLSPSSRPRITTIQVTANRLCNVTNSWGDNFFFRVKCASRYRPPSGCSSGKNASVTRFAPVAAASQVRLHR
jgi:hypothetical protein